MAIFNKPRWLRPEIDEPKYYLHIAIISVIILYLLKLLFGHDMFTFEWIFKIGLLIIAGDIVAHSLLKFD